MDGLAIEKNGIYIDATFGRGGHARALLNRLGPEGVLMCIDRDQEGIDAAHAFGDERMVIRKGTFSHLESWVEELGYGGKIGGILMDLGVSSPQLDDARRGFSFLRDGPLDMRMDQSQRLSAADWLSDARQDEIYGVLRDYGEERFSGRIARAIVEARKVAPITTTVRLAAIVSDANPRWERDRHPATRTFQAIRIFINGELEELTHGLERAFRVLKVGGRLAVITFHSLEDRIVKDFIKKYKGDAVPSWVPLRDGELNRALTTIGRAIGASAEEIKINPRARSATLRIVEKLK